MSSIIIRIIRQMKNDLRSLFLLLFAPLIVLGLMYYILGSTNYKPTVAVVDNTAFGDQVDFSGIETALGKTVHATLITTDVNIDQYLKDKKADAVFYLDDQGMGYLKFLESSSKTNLVLQAFYDTFPGTKPVLETQFVYSYTDDAAKNPVKDTSFNSLGYVFVGLMSFFFIFIIAGMSLVRERTTKTVERMLMTPVRRPSVVGGYILGFGLFAAVQSLIILFYSRYALQLPSVGSIFLCIPIMILLAAAAVSMGTLASTFAASEFQVAQLIPVAVVPQVFFSGLIPLDTIPYHLGYLCYIMPIYYGCTPLKMVMQQGAGITDIWPWLLGLLAFTGLFFLFNVLALRRYRKV